MKEISLLIAEDNPSVREGLAQSISEMVPEVRVDTVKNGREALDFLKSFKADIVITDICMPQLDGLELIRQCRKEKYELDFIIVSGFDDFQYAQRAIRYGVKAYLLKPVSVEELKKEITAMLEAHKAKNRTAVGRSPEEKERELFLHKTFKGDILPESISPLWSRYRLPEAVWYLPIVMDSLYFHEENYDKAVIYRETEEFLKEMPSVGWYDLVLTNTGQFVLLLYFSKEEEMLRQTLQSLNRHLLRRLGYEVYFGVGGRALEQKELPEACRLAERAVSYLLFEPEDKVIFGEDLNQQNIMPTA